MKIYGFDYIVELDDWMHRIEQVRMIRLVY